MPSHHRIGNRPVESSVYLLKKINVSDDDGCNNYRVAGCKIIDNTLLRSGSSVTTGSWIKTGTGTWARGEPFYGVELRLQLDEKRSEQSVIFDNNKLTLVHLFLQCTAVLAGPSVWRSLIWFAAAVNETSLKLEDPVLSDSLLRNKMRALVSALFHFAIGFLVGDPGALDFGGVVDRCKRMI